MKHIILGITSILLCFACSGPRENEVIKIDFGWLDKNADLFSKEVFNSVSYTFLESDTTCMVGNHANLVIMDSLYYIQDPIGQQICCFDSKGNFIQTIGRIGRGPGEYMHSTDFLVDPVTKHVEILAYYNKQIYEYAPSGEFIDSKKDINAYSFIKNRNGHYWFCKGIAADPQIGKEQIFEINTEGEIVRKYLPALHTLPAGVPGKSFSAADQGILYYTQFDNKIYKITSDTIRTLLEFDFGPLAYPEDLFAGSPSEVMQVLTKEDHLAIINCLENQKYIYSFIAQTAVNFKYYHLLYNKTTRKMLCQEVDRNSWEYKFFNQAKALTENNELIFIADPESYNEALKRQNSLFYQTGEPIHHTDMANNLLVKLSINWR